MAKSELNTYGPVGTSWASLKALDADKTPMPNQGMKAIAAICGQASMMGANFQPSGLGNIVAGNNAVMMPPAHQISGMNGAALAGLALGAGALALSMSGKGKKAEVLESKKEGPPAPPTEVPAVKTEETGAGATDATTEAKPTDASKTLDKTPDPTPTKTPGLAGPGTITLSDGAAKKLKGATWIGVGSKAGDAGSESGEKVPTSIKVTPVKDGETSKKGFEMIEYNGNKYWVSPKDQGTYVSWNKAFGTNFGGLKADDSVAKEDPTPPKPVVKPVVAKPTTTGATTGATTAATGTTGASTTSTTGTPATTSTTGTTATTGTTGTTATPTPGTTTVSTSTATPGTTTDTGSTDTGDSGVTDSSVGDASITDATTGDAGPGDSSFSD